MATQTDSLNEAHEAKRVQLMASAEELIAVHGFEALRLRDVAAHAGVSIGMIQHHFITRDELLRNTMRRASALRVEEWARLAEGHESPLAQLTALLTGAVRDRHRCSVWIETCAASTRHEELLTDVQQTQETWRATLLKAVAEGTELGEFSPRLDAGAIAELLVKLIDGSSLAVAIGARRKEAVREAQQQLLAAAWTLLAVD